MKITRNGVKTGRGPSDWFTGAGEQYAEAPDV